MDSALGICGQPADYFSTWKLQTNSLAYSPSCRTRGCRYGCGPPFHSSSQDHSQGWLSPLTGATTTSYPRGTAIPNPIPRSCESSNYPNSPCNCWEMQQLLASCDYSCLCHTEQERTEDTLGTRGFSNLITAGTVAQLCHAALVRSDSQHHTPSQEMGIRQCVSISQWASRMRDHLRGRLHPTSFPCQTLSKLSSASE